MLDRDDSAAAPHRLAAGLAFCLFAALPLPADARSAGQGDARGGGQLEPGEQAHRQEDVSRHRTMAAAHEEAAKCLEAGRAEKECQDALRKACQGIAVGRFCGMRHSH
jgi:hypothetical protein